MTTTKLTLLDPSAFVALRFLQSDEDTRYYLGGVHLQLIEDGYVRCAATDGHLLGMSRIAAGNIADPLGKLKAGVIIQVNKAMASAARHKDTEAMVLALMAPMQIQAAE